MNPPPALSRLAAVLLLAALVLAWFGPLDHRRLIKADEGRYGEIPREMVASGDWLTPRMNGFKYFEKPPLQYWATAAAYSAFGVNEWTTRLWTALTGFAGILFVWFAGNRLFGPPAGAFAAATLSGSALWVFVGHFVTLDMGVAFFMSLAVGAVALAQRDGAGDDERRRWMLAGWAAMALAVLSKGLIGVVLPVAATGLYILVQRDWRLLGRLELLRGGALFLAIAAPWFVAVSLANPEFARFFFIHEHFERFLTKAHGRWQPWWYLLPVLALGAMPLLLPVLVALARGFVPRRYEAEDGRFRPALFLALWCIVVFVFFSASSSKLPSYILPMFPALALLAGRWLPRARAALLALQAALVLAAALAVFHQAGRVTTFADRDLPAAMLEQYTPWLQGAALALGIAGLLGMLLSMRGRILQSVWTLSAGGLLFTQLAITGHETLSPVYSAYHAIEKARPHMKPGAPVYAVNTFDHTLPFYLGQPLVMVAYRDELAVSIGWEPHKFIPSVEEFARRWKDETTAYAVFAPADFELYRKRFDIPAEVLAADPRRVIVARPAH